MGTRTARQGETPLENISVDIRSLKKLDLKESLLEWLQKERQQNISYQLYINWVDHLMTVIKERVQTSFSLSSLYLTVVWLR